MDDDGGDELPGFAPKQHERDKFISGLLLLVWCAGGGVNQPLCFIIVFMLYICIDDLIYHFSY